MLYVLISPGYDSVGCYKDTSSRVIRTMEGTDPILDGSYSTRANPIAKCAVAAMRAGYKMFATAPRTFDRYGKSTACKADGEGGPLDNHVYFVKC